ncbi:MAG: hypothetical protein Q9P01_00500 [Anaerolineae bacterium]|nr:hypothetical protein [Anaerolineae bacterium]
MNEIREQLRQLNKEQLIDIILRCVGRLRIKAVVVKHSQSVSKG